MSREFVRVSLVVVAMLVLFSGCTGNGAPFDTTTLGILFVTQTMPAAGAGQLFDVVIEFGSTGGAALPVQPETQTPPRWLCAREPRCELLKSATRGP